MSIFIFYKNVFDKSTKKEPTSRCTTPKRSLFFPYKSLSFLELTRPSFLKNILKLKKKKSNKNTKKYKKKIVNLL